ncbi:hypothetical protein H4N64_38640 [Streptomyces sp. PSKA01]|uniref:Uncharacterized protein n=1 Tax=Streptomyces cupreus TaxID=2759956 RepID=A0A7X1JB16_9ACTN|nr:hypothetical protein [Streptomyces cupreus]
MKRQPYETSRHGHQVGTESQFVAASTSDLRPPLAAAATAPPWLRDIVAAHFGEAALWQADDLLRAFLSPGAPGELDTDQLLNAVYLRLGGVDLDAKGLVDSVFHRLGNELRAGMPTVRQTLGSSAAVPAAT